MDSFNVDNKIRYYITRVLPYNSKEDNLDLIHMLNRYKKIPKKLFKF